MTIEAIPKLINLIQKHFSISVSISDHRIYHEVSSNLAIYKYIICLFIFNSWLNPIVRQIFVQSVTTLLGN